jgi:hypothetical protein
MKINGSDQILERVRDMREREWNFLMERRAATSFGMGFQEKLSGHLAALQLITYVACEIGTSFFFSNRVVHLTIYSMLTPFNVPTLNLNPEINIFHFI